MEKQKEELSQDVQPVPPQAVVDVGCLLDQGVFSPLQQFVVVLIAFTIMLDGFDSQLLSYAVPSIMQDWNLQRENFTYAVMASPFGMVAGSSLSGLLADRIGRRQVILLALAVCSIATCLVGTASAVMGIAVFRFFTGLGVGGALPVCTTMIAEFAPQRYRTMVVTASIVCVPLGGMLAGLFSRFFLYTAGWRFVFYAGGLLPVVLLAVLWLALPESPRFLARHRNRWSELCRLFARMGKTVGENAVFTEVAENLPPKTHGGFASLLQGGLKRDTLSVWAAFFFCMLAVYAVFGWLPTILKDEGIDSVDAGYGLTVYNLGGVVGALICAWGISRLGSWRALALCAAGGAVSVFLMLLFNLHDHVLSMLVLLALHGLFVNAVQSPLYVLAAHLYPTSIRATGTAVAAACGRAGAIVASFSGGVIGGVTGYFLLLGGAMVLVLLALACIRRHIPAARIFEQNVQSVSV